MSNLMLASCVCCSDRAYCWVCVLTKIVVVVVVVAVAVAVVVLTLTRIIKSVVTDI